MVRHEPDRTDDDGVGQPLGREPPHHVAHVGTEPGFGSPSRALPGHDPLVEPGRRRHEPGRLGQLLGIGVAGLPDPLGQRVRREDHLRPPRHGAQRVLHAGGQEGHQRWVGVPRRHGHEGRRPQRGFGAVEVLLRAQGRAVRREDEADDPLHARCAEQGGGLLDEGVGVLGAERHDVAARRARLELGAHGVDLCRGADRQRRDAADGGVARFELGQLLRRRRTAAPDARVEGGDLARGRRRAVRHEQDARGHARAVSACTSSTTAARMPGSDSGRTP